MEILFHPTTKKLVTYKPNNFNWSNIEKEWVIISIEATDEEIQNILSTTICIDEENEIYETKTAYLDNFDNINNLDFNTFKNRIEYKV